MLARNEYLTAENRILKAQLNGRLERSDAERSTLGEIGHRLGRTALAEVATVAKPDTILAWYRAGRPQVRWLESSSRPRPAAGHAQGRAIDGSFGRGEPGLGL
jgi:hypothetical protein